MFGNLSPILAFKKVIAIHLVILLTLACMLVANRTGIAELYMNQGELGLGLRYLREVKERLPQLDSARFKLKNSSNEEDLRANELAYSGILDELTSNFRKIKAVKLRSEAILEKSPNALISVKNAERDLAKLLDFTDGEQNSLDNNWNTQDNKDLDFGRLNKLVRTSVDDSINQLSVLESNRLESEIQRKGIFDLGFLILLIIESVLLLRPLATKATRNLEDLQAVQLELEQQSAKLEAQNTLLQQLNSEATSQREEMEDKQCLLEKTLSETQVANQMMGIASMRFQDLFRQAPYACFTTDIKGDIYEWNTEAESAFGHIGFCVFEKNAPELLTDVANRPKFLELLKDATEGKTCTGNVFEGLTNLGTTRTFQWSAFPINGANNLCTGVLFAAKDVTDTVQVLNELRIYSSIANQTQTGIIITNVNHEVTFSNEAMSKLLQYTAEELLGSNPVELLHGKDTDPAVIKMIAKKVSKGKPVSARIINYRKDKTPIWLELDISMIRDEFGTVTHYVTHSKDVSLQIEQEAMLILSEKQFKTAVDTMQSGIVIHNLDGTIKYASEQASKLLGLSLDQLHGRSNFHPDWRTIRLNGSIYPGEEHPSSRCIRDQIHLTDQIIGVDVPQQGISWLSVNANPLFDDDNQICGCIVNFSDVTSHLMLQQQIEEHLLMTNEQNIELELNQFELMQANEVLHQMAICDGLTGLLNHRAIVEELKELIQKQEIEKADLSIILVDIDRFKSINDDFGHQVGDKVLKLVSSELNNLSPKEAKAGRYGGEEFLIVLPGYDAHRALAVAENIRVAIESQPNDYRAVTASFGVSTFEHGVITKIELIEQADQALYSCKRGGRNKALHYQFINRSTDKNQDVA